MKCLYGKPCAQSTTQNPVLNQQRKTDPSGSAIKTLAATSFARMMKATYTKKPQPLGNLQNNHILAARNLTTVDPSSCVQINQILVPSGFGAMYNP